MSLDPSVPIPELDQVDFSLYHKPEGVVRAVMIFVDFEDADAGSSSPDDVARHLLGNGRAQRLFRDQSNQEMTLDVTVRSDLGWRRMPDKTKAYETHGDFEPHRKYFEDAAPLFSADVKFSDFALVLVATTENADLGGASSFTAWAGDGASSASGEIRLAVTFDKASLRQTYTTLVHEVAHLFGLPDLYKYSSRHAEDSLAGSWSIMSDSHRSSSFLGWERHKLGWLDDSKKTYVSGDAKGWSQTLHPLSDSSGLSMIVLPVAGAVSPSKVFVVEPAQSFMGKNGRPSAEGVLLYTVDSTITSGQSPVEVLPKTRGYSSDYGNQYLAPCPVGKNLSKSRDGSFVKVAVVGSAGDSYEVVIDYRR